MVRASTDFDNSSLKGGFPSCFNSEEEMRKNPYVVRNYCDSNIIQKRKLPLSKIAFDFYLELVQKEADPDKEFALRKDGDTPREQHEESHLITADVLLKITNKSFIKLEHGSEDAFIAAIILHDVIEDLKKSGQDIRDVLENGLKESYGQQTPKTKQHKQSKHDIDQIIIMVEALSRKDENGVRLDDDRIQQAKQWQEHPYCLPIKLIDWGNKLQTMVGVNHFENDDRTKMTKVIDETSLIFTDEQQDIIGRTIEKWPFIKDACTPMAGVMGILYQTLNTYVKLRNGRLYFDPTKAYPFNFDRYLKQSCDLLEALPKGNNYIGPALERLSNVGKQSPEVCAFLKHMVLPSLHNCTMPKQATVNINTPKVT